MRHPRALLVTRDDGINRFQGWQRRRLVRHELVLRLFRAVEARCQKYRRRRDDVRAAVRYTRSAEARCPTA